MRIFARVAAVQNLSAVGIELGLTPGTISKRIQALEDELRARLFDRTTRSIRITEEGSAFLSHVERILSEIEAARASVDDKVSKPKGKLKIAAPACLGRRYVAPALCEFVRAYPEIDVQIDLYDRQVNLQEDGYDVAIRAGALSSSGLRAKRLVDDPQIVVAAPCYLDRHGAPQAPADLEQHCCLVHGDASLWTFMVDGTEQLVRVNGRLRSDNGSLLVHAAIEGLGILKLSSRRVADALADGLLVRVLPGCAVTPASAIYAVYPGSQLVLPKLRVFLDFLGVWFGEARNGARANGDAGHARNGSGLRIYDPLTYPACVLPMPGR